MSPARPVIMGSGRERIELASRQVIKFHSTTTSTGTHDKPEIDLLSIKFFKDANIRRKLLRNLNELRIDKFH